MDDAPRARYAVRDEPAVRTAGPDERDALQDFFRRDGESLRERRQIEECSKAARKVPGAAISV